MIVEIDNVEINNIKSLCFDQDNTSLTIEIPRNYYIDIDSLKVKNDINILSKSSRYAYFGCFLTSIKYENSITTMEFRYDHYQIYLSSEPGNFLREFRKKQIESLLI